MERYIENEKISRLLFIVVLIMYAIVYMSKVSYTAAITSIVAEGLFKKSQAGTISASFYIIYAIGQFLGGRVADRVSPYLLILLGIVGGAICNLLILFFHSFFAVLIIWSANALIQFGVWPSVSRILISHLEPSHRISAMVYIGYTAIVGVLFSYIMAACVQTWKHLFLFSAISLGILALVWILVSSISEKNRNALPAVVETALQASVQPKSAKWLYMQSGLLFIFFARMFFMILENGMTAWFPTMMVENYDGIGVTVSLALTIIPLAIQLLSPAVARIVYPNLLRDEVKIMVVSCALGVPCIISFLWMKHVSVFLIVALFAFLRLSMGVAGNLSNVPSSRFAFYGKTATVSGITNAFASFGNALSLLGSGLLAERFGWTVTIWMWIVSAGVTTLSYALSLPFWGRFCKQQEEEAQILK